MINTRFYRIKFYFRIRIFVLFRFRLWILFINMIKLSNLAITITRWARAKGISSITTNSSIICSLRIASTMLTVVPYITAVPTCIFINFLFAKFVWNVVYAFNALWEFSYMYFLLPISWLLLSWHSPNTTNRTIDNMISIFS